VTPASGEVARLVGVPPDACKRLFQLPDNLSIKVTKARVAAA